MFQYSAVSRPALGSAQTPIQWEYSGQSVTAAMNKKSESDCESREVTSMCAM
jgi:hypothetical protein